MKLPNGTGSISKLSGHRRNPFIVRKTMGYTMDGKAKVKIVGYYPKYADAMQALLEYNNDPSLYDASKFTFEDAYNGLCQEKFTNAGKSIPNQYSNAYRRCSALYGLSMQSIRLIHINDIINNAPSYSTKRDVRMVINQVFKYALRNEIIIKNPVDNAINPQIEKSNLHQPFTMEELKQLWSLSNDRNARLWLIYIYTGVRPQELTTIETANIHLEENYMIGGIKNDYSKNRMIPIADCIKPFIADFYDPTNKYLIRPPHKDRHPDRPMTYKTLTTGLATVNPNHHPHDGRHTCATLLNDCNVNLTTIQFVLGQSPQSVAGKVYVHKNLLKMLDAVNLLPHF